MLYVTLLILGGTLLAASLVFHHDTDAAHAADWGDVGAWLNVRGLVSGVAFAGLAGLLAQLTGVAAGRVPFVALASGIVAYLVTSAVIIGARRHEVHTRTVPLVGRTGTVLLPPDVSRPGKVKLSVTGGTRDVLARSSDELRVGEHVIVIGEDAGVVDVRRWDGLA